MALTDSSPIVTSVIDSLFLPAESPTSSFQPSISGTGVVSTIVTASGLHKILLLGEALLLALSATTTIVENGKLGEESSNSKSSVVTGALSAAACFHLAAAAVKQPAEALQLGREIHPPEADWDPSFGSFYVGGDNNSSAAREILGVYSAVRAACAGILSCVGDLAAPSLMEASGLSRCKSTDNFFSIALSRAADAIALATQSCAPFAMQNLPLFQTAWRERASLRQVPSPAVCRTHALMRIALGSFPDNSGVRGCSVVTASTWPAVLNQISATSSDMTVLLAPPVVRGSVWTRQIFQQADSTRAALSLAASAGVAREVQAELAAQLASRDRDLTEMKARIRSLESFSSAPTANTEGVNGAPAPLVACHRELQPINRDDHTRDISVETLQAALCYTRNECSTLRARLGELKCSPALSWLAQHPLRENPVTVNGQLQVANVHNHVVSVAQTAIEAARMLHIRRRIPLLGLQNHSSSEGKMNISEVANHALSEACAAVTVNGQLQVASNLLLEAKLISICRCRTTL